MGKAFNSTGFGLKFSRVQHDEIQWQPVRQHTRMELLYHSRTFDLLDVFHIDSVGMIILSPQNSFTK